MIATSSTTESSKNAPLNPGTACIQAQGSKYGESVDYTILGEHDASDWGLQYPLV